MLSDAAIREYLERLVQNQRLSEEPRDRLNEIKREARGDGLNMDAVNALLPLLVKYPHDKGATAVNEMIRYAEVFGAEILVSRTAAPAAAPSAPSADADVLPPVNAEIRLAAVPRRRPAAPAHLRLSTQVVAAVGLTVGLIWLLN